MMCASISSYAHEKLNDDEYLIFNILIGIAFVIIAVCLAYYHRKTKFKRQS